MPRHTYFHKKPHHPQDDLDRKVYKSYVWVGTEQLGNVNTMLGNSSYMKYRV